MTGLKVSYTCWSTWLTDPHSSLDVTHIDTYAEVFLLKVTWRYSDNNAIEQNWSHTQTFWEWNLWTTHTSKQLEAVTYTNNDSVHNSTSLDPRFTHLPDTNTTFYRTHGLLIIRVTSRYFIYFTDKTHLTHQKSDPSDSVVWFIWPTFNPDVWHIKYYLLIHGCPCIF